jgi:hypothetical protein
MSPRTTKDADRAPGATSAPDPAVERGAAETRRRWEVPGRVIVAVAFLLAVGLLLLFAPGALAQSGNDVAKNLGDLLRGYAAQFYGGVIAIVSLIFLINRRYVELMTFLIAAVVVGWMVFSPDAIAKAARAIGRQVLG